MSKWSDIERWLDCFDHVETFDGHEFHPDLLNVVFTLPPDPGQYAGMVKIPRSGPVTFDTPDSAPDINEDAAIAAGLLVAGWVGFPNERGTQNA